MGDKDKERLNNLRDGKDARVLLGMLIKSISILDKLINNTNDWGRGGTNKHKRIVQELCKKVFKKRGYENQKDEMRDGLPYQGNDH